MANRVPAFLPRAIPYTRQKKRSSFTSGWTGSTMAKTCRISCLRGRKLLARDVGHIPRHRTTRAMRALTLTRSDLVHRCRDVRGAYMPRKPTGRPRGRPVGTGFLGEQTRVTIRMPTALSARLEAYTDGRGVARGGSPQLAACVREALEYDLVCPQKRQTRPQAATATRPEAQSSPRLRTRQTVKGEVNEFVP